MLQRILRCGIPAFALLFVGCAMLEAPKAPVKAHLKAWSEKNYEAAYSYFSPELKDSQSLDEFTTGAQGVLIKSFDLNNVTIKNATAVVKGIVTLEDGRKWGCRYKLIERGKEWLIFGFKVSPNVLFEEEEKEKEES